MAVYVTEDGLNIPFFAIGPRSPFSNFSSPSPMDDDQGLPFPDRFRQELTSRCEHLFSISPPPPCSSSLSPPQQQVCLQSRNLSPTNTLSLDAQQSPFQPVINQTRKSLPKKPSRQAVFVPPGNMSIPVHQTMPVHQEIPIEQTQSANDIRIQNFLKQKAPVFYRNHEDHVAYLQKKRIWHLLPSKSASGYITRIADHVGISRSVVESWRLHLIKDPEWTPGHKKGYDAQVFSFEQQQHLAKLINTICKGLHLPMTNALFRRIATGFYYSLPEGQR
jgi:hypothetical protein